MHGGRSFPIQSEIRERKLYKESLKVVKSNSEQKKYPCKYCGKLFKSKCSVSSHKSQSHADLRKSEKQDGKLYRTRKVKCLFCTEELTNMKISNHLLTMHFHEQDNPKYHEMMENCRTICSDCGKEFGSRQSYIHHLYKEHKTKVDKDNMKVCKTCEETFVSIYALEVHINRVHEEYKRYCVECDKNFDTRHSFNFHLKQFHTPKIECTECGKKFTEKRLPFHMKVMHVKEKDFHCNECPKKFAFSQKLKKHKLTVHLNFKPFGCEKCIYKSSNSFNLNLHRRKMHQATDKINKSKLLEIIKSGNHPFCGTEFITMLNKLP